MKIEKVKKKKYYICSFWHILPNGEKIECKIDKENNCETKDQLVDEIKRIKTELDSIEPEPTEEEVEEIELSTKEIEEIEGLVLAEPDSGTL